MNAPYNESHINELRNLVHNLENIAWAIENKLTHPETFTDTDIQALHTAASILDTEAASMEVALRENVQRQEVNMADEAYRADLMGLYDGPEMWEG